MNDTTKSVFRVLGILAAILLSIALIALLIVAPLYNTTVSITKGETIAKVIRSIDYTTLLPDEDSAGDIIQSGMEEVADGNIVLEDNLDNYIVPVIESPLVEDVIGLYIDDIAAALEDGDAIATLTPEALAALTDKHMDDVIEIAKEHTPNGDELTDEEIRQTVTAIVDTHGEEFIEALPDADTVRTVIEDSSIAPVVNVVFGKTVPYVLYGVILLLAVLIFFCLYGRARGLLCLGIDALIAGLPLVVICLLLSDAPTLITTLGLGEDVSGILLPLINTLSGNLLTGTIVLIVVGLLLVAGYVVYNVVQNNRTKTTTEIPA